MDSGSTGGLVTVITYLLIKGEIQMSKQSELRVGLIGTQFMGKAHSNAWSQVGHFFPSSVKVVKQAICGRNEARAKEMAHTWEWNSVETDWRTLIDRKDIDLID